MGDQTDGNPFTTHMNAVTKYVVSRTLENAGAWQNSILLRGEAAKTVAELKAQPGHDLAIIGSASLIHALHAAGLIDTYTLLLCSPPSRSRMSRRPHPSRVSRRKATPRRRST